MSRKQPVINSHGLTQTKDDFGKTTITPTSKRRHGAPGIIREYNDAEGVRMYECTPRLGEAETRHFIAEVYDKSFIPMPVVRTRGRKLYGNAGNYKLIYK